MDANDRYALFWPHLSPLKDPKMAKNPEAPCPRSFQGVITIFMP